VDQFNLIVPNLDLEAGKPFQQLVAKGSHPFQKRAYDLTGSLAVVNGKEKL
jgi:hypothetical protein